jgi:hypothetical protein
MTTQTHDLDDAPVQCPRCGSHQIHAEKRGFSFRIGESRQMRDEAFMMKLVCLIVVLIGSVGLLWMR